ncbi:MAG: phosphomannomutase/phosphoglucomutase [Candidatus Andersenbacteria bacterium]|nr:phosphomannomutase/phosphoglucomutase [Candidatus Andersenbacteria bacterium]MBI3251239.1 phosphomannomutase/phosphoglucomutase [Candidatus Andersenbacteria bacterium]
MPFNPNIYRSYDIRGVVPDDLDAAEGYHIGRAYAHYTNAKKVVVARDMRQSGVEIEKEVMRGLTEGGVNVISIGMASTPMFYFAVHHLKTDGGLMVTASHNPAKYNGVKITRAEAVPVGGDSGLMDIRDLVAKRTWPTSENIGVVTTQDVRQAYLDLVTKNVQANNLNLVVDAGNGMVGMLLPEYFQKVGGNVTQLYWEPDGTFPNHEADPLTAKNRVDAEKAVLQQKADIGIMYDGDGDRVFFIDETGKTIPGDISLALIAREFLKEHTGATILYDLRSSRATAEAIKESGGRAVMSKVGHSNIKKQMREEKAVFAGEVSGHFYFTPLYAESALLATGYIIRLMQESGQRLSELVAPLMRYAKTEEINFEVEDKEAVLAKLKGQYSDAQILELDGISIIYKNWWANIRPSNTEPLLRLNMEASTPELLVEKQAEIEAILQG